jgi:hypothetical protein
MLVKKKSFCHPNNLFLYYKCKKGKEDETPNLILLAVLKRRFGTVFLYLYIYTKTNSY